MLKQRFQLEATIGGFSDSESLSLPTFHNEERDKHVQIALSEQFARAQAAFCDFTNAIGNPSRSAHRGVIFDEAMKNVMYHGFPYQNNRCDASAQSVCRLTIETLTTKTSRSITYILALNDHTPVFERSLVPDPTDDEHVAEAKGRGIFIMEGFGAIISQIPHSQGKTVVYTWHEEVSQEKPPASGEESGSD